MRKDAKAKKPVGYNAWLKDFEQWPDVTRIFREVKSKTGNRLEGADRADEVRRILYEAYKANVIRRNFPPKSRERQARRDALGVASVWTPSIDMLREVQQLLEAVAGLLSTFNRPVQICKNVSSGPLFGEALSVLSELQRMVAKDLRSLERAKVSAAAIAPEKMSIETSAIGRVEELLRSWGIGAARKAVVSLLRAAGMEHSGQRNTAWSSETVKKKVQRYQKHPIALYEKAKRGDLGGVLLWQIACGRVPAGTKKPQK